MELQEISPDYPTGLEDLDIGYDPGDPDEPEEYHQPDEAEQLFTEMLEICPPNLAMDILHKLGILNDWKESMSAKLIKVERIRRIEEQMEMNKGTEAGYDNVTRKYRLMFENIKIRARERAAQFLPSEFEVIYSSDKSEQNGPSKRNFIMKNQQRYLPPGIWCIASRTVTGKNPNGSKKFISSDCIVKYMTDPPKSNPDMVWVVPMRRGRPDNERE